MYSLAFILSLGRFSLRRHVFDLVQPGHESGYPGDLELAAKHLQPGEAVQDAAVDEVVGQDRLRLDEQVYPQTGIGRCFLRCLPHPGKEEGVHNPAGEDVQVIGTPASSAAAQNLS